MYMIVAGLVMALAVLVGQAPLVGQAAKPLDYAFYKANVEPIFLAKRAGHTRCSTCHMGGRRFTLQHLDEGATTWTDEQSRENFDAVRRLVQPGDLQSRLLVHPLLESAGGDFFHNGGKHWQSKSDPEWQTLSEWVMGATLSE